MTQKTKRYLKLERIAERLLPDNDGTGPSPADPQVADVDFDSPDLPETLLEDIVDEFATFGGSDPLDKSANDDFDDINTMSDSRWRLFLEDTDPDPMDIDPNNTTFHSCSSQDAGSSSFFSARSGLSTDNDDEEEVTFRPQRGLSNDNEDPKLAEQLDNMIHQRREFFKMGL